MQAEQLGEWRTHQQGWTVMVAMGGGALACLVGLRREGLRSAMSASVEQRLTPPKPLAGAKWKVSTPPTLVLAAPHEHIAPSPPPSHSTTTAGMQFRACMYPKHGPAGGGLLRLHSTYRHDLKIYSSDEGRVQVCVWGGEGGR